MPQCFKSYQQKCENYGIFATIYSKMKHRAFPVKLNRQLNKPCADNMSFRIVTVSEGLDKSTEEKYSNEKS